MCYDERSAANAPDFADFCVLQAFHLVPVATCNNPLLSLVTPIVDELKGFNAVFFPLSDNARMASWQRWRSSRVTSMPLSLGKLVNVGHDYSCSTSAIYHILDYTKN